MTKNIIEYVIACISEFAEFHSLSLKDSFDYLYKFKGIDYNIQQKLNVFKDKFRELSKVDFSIDSREKNEFIKNFIEKLEKVIIYRIEVPEHTDLNRYFEIMNTRGEQLEKTDILKAELMSFLGKENEIDKNKRKQLNDQQSLFAKIWEACSDMTGYVQMHLISKNNVIRDAIFGNNWNLIPQNISSEDALNKMLGEIAKLENKSQNNNSNNQDNKDINENNESYYIENIIQDKFKIEKYDDWSEDEKKRVRFESIISFPYFLLHTLKVFIKHYNIHQEEESEIIDELLDDKKLIDTFKKVIKFGVMNNQKIRNNKDFSLKFIDCLLKTRFLFDKYIIKREYANDNLDGQWSLKELNVSGGNTNRKPYYKNTLFISKDNDSINKKNLMIQSALRVSYTSPKVMHWITELLIWLYENQFEKDIEKHKEILFNPCWKAEMIAAKSVKKDFLENPNNKEFKMGVNTPHIVFNFLDYLLWLDDSEKNYSDFIFEFRNSVEHWYPQNPSDGREKWKDVDRFVNLCIIQRNINSRFSNMPPESKKITFKNMICKGSIKLRIMSDLTNKNQSDFNWKELCKNHESEMINKLENGCKEIMEKMQN